METKQELGRPSRGAGIMVTSSWRRMVPGLAAVLLLSCGVFSPRDSEQPQPVENGRLDPFSLHEIMDGTGYPFPGIPYEDLFTDNVVYKSMNSPAFTKNELIQRFQQIQLIDTNVQVRWVRNGGVPLKRGNDTLLFSGLRYSIFRSGKMTSAPDDSGSSDMTMVRVSANWRICQWQDVPDGQQSYFSPGFSATVK